MAFVKQVISRLTEQSMAKGSTLFQGALAQSYAALECRTTMEVEDANRPWIARERALVKNMESNLEQSAKIQAQS